MKKFRFAALLTTLALALVMPFAVAEETIDPAQLMEDVAGTYVPLFSVLNKPEYDDVWLSHSARDRRRGKRPDDRRHDAGFYHGPRSTARKPWKLMPPIRRACALTATSPRA